MPYKVKVLDTAAMEEMLHGPNGATAKSVLKRALRVEAAAKRRVKADKGRLRQSINHELVRTAQKLPGARVGTNVSYAKAVHEGTGVYGPHGMPIVPTGHTFLKFTYNGVTVYARSVRGQQPNRFLTDALHEA